MVHSNHAFEFSTKNLELEQTGIGPKNTITLFYSNATAGSAEPAFGSHLAYHTNPQGNQNDTVTQERLQIFENEIQTNSRSELENKILFEASAENFEWAFMKL